MVVGVARGVYSADSSTFDGKDLTIGNRLLCSTGRMFVDRVGEMRVETEEVGDSARMVTVPMSEKYVREGEVGGDSGQDQVGPFWDALASVDDESF